MLQLIKYDLKRGIPKMILLGIVGALTAGVGNVLHRQIDWSSGGDSFLLLSVIQLLLFATVALAFTLLIAGDYYRQIHSAEGYLTFTLPISSGKYILGKAIGVAIQGAILFSIVVGGFALSMFFLDGVETVQRWVFDVSLESTLQDWDRLLSYYGIGFLFAVSTLFLGYLSVNLSKLRIGGKRISFLWFFLFLALGFVYLYLPFEVLQDVQLFPTGHALASIHTFFGSGWFTYFLYFVLLTVLSYLATVKTLKKVDIGA